VPGPFAVFPSGVVIATSTMIAAMIAAPPMSSWRPLNGPTRPWRSRRWLNAGRSATQIAVLKLK
jgi:hypothetical protein